MYLDTFYVCSKFVPGTIHTSNTLLCGAPRVLCYSLMRVNSINIQDEGLRIGRIGHRINSKVRISQTRHVSRIYMVVNLAYSQSVPGRLSWPLYIGGQVSRNQSGLIHITVSVYDINSYFDYDYSWA
jgi:hypothetical protein